MYNPKLLKPYLKTKYDNNIEIKNKELYLLCECGGDDQKASIRALKSKFLKEFRDASNGENNGETNDIGFIKKNKESHFFKLFRMYNMLPFYLRWKSIDLYYKILNSEDSEDPEGEFSYFLTLSYLYDAIDEGINPEIFNDKFYLKQELEYEEKCLELHAFILYKKDLEELTEGELGDVREMIESDRDHSLELLNQLEEEWENNSDPLKIKCDILLNQFYLNLSYFNNNDTPNVKKELGHLFIFYNKIYPEDPKSYSSFVERWDFLTKESPLEINNIF